MNLINRQYRKSDVAFCIVVVTMFLLAAPLWTFSFHDTHSPLSITLAAVGIWLTLASLALLPMWLLVHALRNRGRTKTQFFYIETVLLLTWLGTAAYFWMR
jgi:uncharacterized membrane protein